MRCQSPDTCRGALFERIEPEREVLAKIVQGGLALKSPSIPWTRHLFNSECPCGSGEKSFKCCWRGDGRWEKTPVGAINLPLASVPPSENDRCYLSILGNCSSKITKEHFVSRNILERITADRLTFENAGHFFGGKERVEIGVNDFAAKVLCDIHNPALSILDTAAGIAFSAIEATAKDITSAADPSAALKSFHLSSGIDIERWMVKVYCGLVAAGKIRSATGRVLPRSNIPSRLLDALLGINCLPSPLGLYYHTYVGQTRQLGGISFGTIKLTNGSDDVGGLILSLGPMNFVLITSMAYGIAFKEPNWYRHPTFLFNVRQGHSRIAYFLTY